MYKQINYGKGFFPSSNRRPSQTDSVSTQLCARAALSVRVVSLLFPFFFSRTYINLKSRLMNCFRPGAHEDGFNTSRVRRKSRRGTWRRQRIVHEYFMLPVVFLFVSDIFLIFFFRFVIFYRPRILLRLLNRRWNAATARHSTGSYIVRGGQKKKWQKISERRQLLQSLHDFQPSPPWLTVFRNKSLKEQ